MSRSIIQQLADFGQSPWLDYIDRNLLESGKLQGLIDSGLRGMTSNPSIFNQAIGLSDDYDEKIVEFKNAGKSTFEIYDELTIKDIQEAADIFLPVYQRTNQLDGYVSLEINPLLAHKLEEQIDEGVRLFEKVGRPNIMIKVPSTKEGIVVFEELISRGINVNVTLIFSLNQYEQTAKAYINGLAKLSDNGGDLSQVRSVASVFISRIDTAVDKLLEEKLLSEENESQKDKIKTLMGRAAVANSRIIFEHWKSVFASDDFKGLTEKGAHVQRVLWGSTSTKNAVYNDVKYVAELITKPTVNTIPEKTLNAFADHGEVKEAFTYDVKEAEEVVASLNDFGISINDVNQTLLEDGCKAFDKAFEELLENIENKAKKLIVN